ncbi:hypothetical protein [Spartinivicinus ruber]|uniref:hypothetical protein n=1 Tax=Spartinivicinus ruber TaxID=2683272 RepID=UPI0013D7750E|nr:hypothetical protein [Spartinivicinus ruber]
MQQLNDTAFIGISIFKPRFMDKKSLVNYLSFIRKEWPRLTIVIADKPEIFNLQTMENIKYNQAMHIITKRGVDIKKNIQEKFNDVNIVLWQDIEFKLESYVTILNSHIESCAEFKYLLFGTVAENLRPRYGDIEMRKLYNLSKYLIQELAQTIYFNIDLGIKNEIYPGKIGEVKKYVAELMDLTYSYYDVRNRSITKLYTRTSKQSLVPNNANDC